MSLLEDLEMLKEKIKSQFPNHTCAILTDDNRTDYLKVSKLDKTERHIYPVGNGKFQFNPTAKSLTSQNVISKL